jgi:hypothetical protein
LAAYADAPFVLPEKLGDQSAPRRRAWSNWSRGWLAVSGAIAAAILAMVIPAPMREGRPTPRAPIQAPTPFDSGIIHPVSSKPVMHRATGRELMGVVGEDGNLYWIEVERVRTIRLPNGRLGLTGNEL